MKWSITFKCKGCGRKVSAVQDDQDIMFSVYMCEPCTDHEPKFMSIFSAHPEGTMRVENERPEP